MFHGQLLFIGLGVLSIVIGIPLARRLVPPNRWYGVRIPATLRNPAIWYEINAKSGRDLIWLGATLIVVAVALPRVTALPPGGYVAVITVAFVVASLILTFRATVLARRLDRKP